MGRKKIEIKPITDERNRLVTFAKRKQGIFRKAYELSILCECEIALIIFSKSQRVYEYGSSDLPKILKRYSSTQRPHESLTNKEIRKNIEEKSKKNSIPENGDINCDIIEDSNSDVQIDVDLPQDQFPPVTHVAVVGHVLQPSYKTDDVATTDTDQRTYETVRNRKFEEIRTKMPPLKEPIDSEESLKNTYPFSPANEIKTPFPKTKGDFLETPEVCLIPNKNASPLSTNSAQRRSHLLPYYSPKKRIAEDFNNIAIDEECPDLDKIKTPTPLSETPKNPLSACATSSLLLPKRPSCNSHHISPKKRVPKEPDRS